MALSLTTPFLPSAAATTMTATHKLLSQAPSQTARCSMRKKGVHPEFFPDAKVYCNGELVMTTGGTKPEYTVDVWSGNHPYYLGDSSALMELDSPIEKYQKRYGHLEDMKWMTEVPVLLHGTIEPPQRESKKKKK